jgi:hypothetical protein
MGDATQTSAPRLPGGAEEPGGTGGKKKSAPRSPGTRLLLSRLPVTILAVAYAVDFLVRQVPEFAGIRGIANVARQASVLVWAPLPGTGGAGATGTDGVFMLLATIGAILLAGIGTRPVVAWEAVPVTVRGLTRWTAVPAAALVAAGLVDRILAVLDQSWSPAPAGGLAFAALAAVTAIFAAREIVLTDPADQPRSSGGETDGAGWRGKAWFILIAITWIGDVAIGRYFEPRLIAVIAAVAPAKRWAYLGDNSSWWLYLLGLLVVFIGYALLQPLPPWDGRVRQIVTAAIFVIIAFIAFQQVHPYAHDAVTHVIQHAPK